MTTVEHLMPYLVEIVGEGHHAGSSVHPTAALGGDSGKEDDQCPRIDCIEGKLLR
jgi:hypothetical protein